VSGGGHGGRFALLWAVLATVMLLFAASSTAAEARSRPADPFTMGNPAFCAPTKPVRDFGLSRLPPVREMPESGDLPFGPKTVHLGSFGGRVLPIGQSFGFELHSENYAGRTPLRWTLRAQMFVVGRDGATGREVDRLELEVRTISSGDEVELYLDPLRRAGFYRYDFEIVDGEGRVLGSYGEYLKVFARSYWKPRLGLAKRSFRPGELVLSRVENFGTEWVYYAESFSVQRLEGKAWGVVPDVTRRRWARWLGIIGPGVSGRCNSLSLPDDFPAGRYRIVKAVGPHPWPRGQRSYRLTAPFTVID
jgi:hypothetical protein